MDLALDWSLLVLAGYLAFKLGWWALDTFFLSQWVEGQANQWVVIIRNGAQKSAGIGLACYKSYWDSVAIFPARLNRVKFTASQVTKEMQGLDVSMLVVWTVLRTGDGPFKAYTNLNFNNDAADANSLIGKIASSIVRNRMANSDMNSIIKDRMVLRTACRDELQKIVKGWGVWIESVEITDVKICSGSLFRNLQTKFRENNRKTATIQQTAVENELDLATKKDRLETSKQRVIR